MLFEAGIHSVADARRLAQRRLPWMVFDYIDGAAGDETGPEANRRALQDVHLMPRVLRNVSNRSLSVSLFGEEKERPFGICPMGMCNLSTPGADLMLARLAAKYKIPHGVSTVSSTTMEEIYETSEGQAWFQLYFSGDGVGTMKLLERAKNIGYKTLVLTLDVPEVGRRPRELRHGFKMPFKIGLSQFVDFAMHPRWSLSTLLAGKPQMANFDGKEYVFDRTESRAAADWKTFERIRDSWPGNLVAKGVLACEDARRLKDSGVDAIQVSSHGSRQLNAAPPPILALQEIRKEIGEDFPLFYDSGIRSGEDIVKAYAMGADYVFLGRALLFALAAGGEKGLVRLFEILSREIDISLAQLGATKILLGKDRNKFGVSLTVKP
ncbi:alpha-hydroxy acid oxidase [Kiloniella sp. EL199]|uniref:alpha-hydroxy acid oxidase n=1 Tax=Kiloniella sp. EL199 TaxID=2107581 RepID=UPI000EA348DF|nr:alpha-hydroxy acid oxidase [Kiloniella sp. EL199]